MNLPLPKNLKGWGRRFPDEFSSEIAKPRPAPTEKPVSTECRMPQNEAASPRPIQSRVPVVRINIVSSKQQPVNIDGSHSETDWSTLVAEKSG
jgi:hypothetical protein